MAHLPGKQTTRRNLYAPCQALQHACTLLSWIVHRLSPHMFCNNLSSTRSMFFPLLAARKISGSVAKSMPRNDCDDNTPLAATLAIVQYWQKSHIYQVLRIFDPDQIVVLRICRREATAESHDISVGTSHSTHYLNNFCEPSEPCLAHRKNRHLTH